jgi:ABC-2 type transport system permease protein
MLALFAGLGVGAFALVPRLTIPVTAAAAVIAFVLEMLGPAVHWPAWLLNVSPFHHLAGVPVEPMNLPAAVAMTAVGIAFAVTGIVSFERRDLLGA